MATMPSPGARIDQPALNAGRSDTWPLPSHTSARLLTWLEQPLQDNESRSAVYLVGSITGEILTYGSHYLLAALFSLCRLSILSTARSLRSMKWIPSQGQSSPRGPVRPDSPPWHRVTTQDMPIPILLAKISAWYHGANLYHPNGQSTFTPRASLTITIKREILLHTPICTIG
ncbi:hypothetical protein BOTBODRAFT_533211 [Botryobasidium botryosum FD-172 SS1]|uniref:Uncharacterized protein n=1 Tax=Botryobasidium botryosum (strain FD-172 SS1) TaxID=930990 RepID=A0A067M0A5_BOTB1|nr:hypothetical protein BOTBODRAFT_533211 [Botryobasidium botryosum FD-172 SS1]